VNSRESGHATFPAKHGAAGEAGIGRARGGLKHGPAASVNVGAVRGHIGPRGQ